VLLLRHKDQQYNNPLASFAICLCNSALTSRNFVPRLELLPVLGIVYGFSEKYENV